MKRALDLHHLLRVLQSSLSLNLSRSIDPHSSVEVSSDCGFRVSHNQVFQGLTPCPRHPRRNYSSLSPMYRCDNYRLAASHSSQVVQ